MVQTRSKSAAKAAVEHPCGNTTSSLTSSAYHSQGHSFQLNFDVLLLLAAYANPLDFLNLACTCKHFRELLMDKSSALVWKAVRGKAMPDCPEDMTEQEYTDLAFSARCRGCGGYASSVLWEIRLRYCPDCKVERLCHLPLCPKIIQKKYVLGMEHVSIGNEIPLCVDREQMESFMNEYNRSSESGKKKLLGDRQERLVAIRNHARKCETWQRRTEPTLRQNREDSIFERLEQLGYEPEVEYFGRYAIRESQKPSFNTTKPLTDKEWSRIWPEWLETMNNFQLRRLDQTVFQSRRQSLAYEYDKYVTRSSKETPSFDLLPRVADVARFPPFKDIIRRPDEFLEDGQLFESAFLELPKFVDEWRKKLDTEMAELVEVPSHLSALGSATDLKSSGLPTDRLRLACALFRGGDRDLHTHPEVFYTCMARYKYPRQGEDESECTGTIQDRYGIRYVRGAPYVMHACGLDPNVATAEDMDRRNARLRCASCNDSSNFYDWREATWHASSQFNDHLRWQLVDDNSEEMAKILAAEAAGNKEGWPIREIRPRSSLCLLCHRHRVGDEEKHDEIRSHLKTQHKIGEREPTEGVHYLPLCKAEHCWVRKGKKEYGSEIVFGVHRDRLPSGYWY